MLTIKDGVSIARLQPQMAVALLIAERIYERHSIDLVLTSGNDSRHGPNSLHGSGKAIDLRVKNIPNEYVKKAIFTALLDALSEEFDVLWENQGTPSEHFHIEFDPK